MTEGGGDEGCGYEGCGYEGCGYEGCGYGGKGTGTHRPARVVLKMRYFKGSGTHIFNNLQR